MKTLRRYATIAAVGAVALGAVGANSASAQQATSATVEITGGALSITVPTDAGSLGTRANTVEGGTIADRSVRSRSATLAALLPDPAGWPA